MTQLEWKDVPDKYSTSRTFSNFWVALAAIAAGIILGLAIGLFVN